MIVQELFARMDRSSTAAGGRKAGWNARYIAAISVNGLRMRPYRGERLGPESVMAPRPWGKIDAWPESVITIAE